VIKKGETAAQVARLHGLSLTELAQLNPGLRLSRLSVGSRLNTEAAGPEPSTAPAAAALLATPRVPLSPLPAAPVFASTPMPHLERLLPYQPRTLIPADGRQVATQEDPNSLSQLLSRLQPVLPPLTEAEYRALLPVYTPADPEHLDLIWPVETRTISSAWGPRMRTRTVRVKNQRKKRVRYKGRHKGIDFTARVGTAVFAALDGEVVVAGRHKQYGNYVVVAHGNGIVTLYAHHSLNLARVGDIVRRGQKIAEVGRTGNATGPHLHFELKVDGLQCNPLPVLNDEEEIPVELAAQNAMVGSNHGDGSSSYR
jgi:murein DD-endopeptidase MepM/ murein hydrolase activator NlpD